MLYEMLTLAIVGVLTVPTVWFLRPRRTRRTAQDPASPGPEVAPNDTADDTSA